MLGIKRLISNWVGVVKDFPIATLILLFLTINGCLLIADYQTWGSDWPLFLAGGISFFLSLLGPIWLLHQAHITLRDKSIAWGGQLMALVVGFLYYYFCLRFTHIWSYWEEVQYYGVLGVSIVLVLVGIALVVRKQQEKIWYSWTNLFQSIVFGLLGGVIVWGGISGALAAIDLLFEVHFAWEWYGYIGIISMILLAGSFILNYYTYCLQVMPKGDSVLVFLPSRLRKIFGTYIFLTLVIVYFAIVVAYIFKILLTGIRPQGVIVGIGLGYFALGMLCYYFTFPEEGKAYEAYYKAMFGSFIIVAIMMACALGQRVMQYGISINRYLVFVLILFILSYAGIALFFPKWRLKSLIFLLFGLGVGAIYGPLSAGRISFLAQMSRLEADLVTMDRYLPLGHESLSGFEHYEKIDNISSQIAYIVEYYPSVWWFGKLLDTQVVHQGEGVDELKIHGIEEGIDSDKNPEELFLYYTFPWSREDEVRKFLGITYSYANVDPDTSEYFHYYEYNKYELLGTLDISQYRWLAWSDSLNMNIEGAENRLTYDFQGKQRVLDLTPYLQELYEWAKHSGEEKKAPFMLNLEDVSYVITHLHGEKDIDEKGAMRIDDIEFMVLVK